MDQRIENTLWVEKYRPKKLADFIGNETVITKIQSFIDNEDISQMLLTGPAGTGKTTLAKIIVNSIKCDYIYINASDENSIDVMRNKIKGFVSSVGFNNLKIVILDESDFLSQNAQAGLRSLMETFSRSSRFILTCNYPEKLLDPIKSRCQLFEIFPPSKGQVAKKLADILTSENVSFSNEDVAFIVKSEYPDIRKVINNAQLYTIDNELIIDKKIIIAQNYMLQIIEILKSKTIKKEQKFTEIRQLIADNKTKYYEPLFKLLFDSIEIIIDSYDKRAGLILCIADAQFHDSIVVDKEINVMSMIVKILDII